MVITSGKHIYHFGSEMKTEAKFARLHVKVQFSARSKNIHPFLPFAFSLRFHSEFSDGLRPRNQSGVPTPSRGGRRVKRSNRRRRQRKSSFTATN